MQKPVRGADYFENDDNGLWSWYLTNIRNGDFEELTGNQLKRSLLKRFLHTNLDPEFSSRPDTKVMIVSIPDDIHRDLTLLESFLHDYFHLDNMQITKLTQSHIYNHENHYIVKDKVNNFRDPGFLQFASRNLQLTSLPGTTKQKEHNGSNGRTVPVVPKDSDNFAVSGDLTNPMVPKDPKSATEKSPEGAEIDEDSIVINFSHHGHYPIPIESNHQDIASTNDISSIDSYNLGKGSDGMGESYEGPPLSLTTTRTGGSLSSEDDSSELSSAGSGSSLQSDDDWSSSQFDTLMSILPSISIEDSFGHFRLVLQSVLFQNLDNDEIFTAIRQSNNEPTVADVNDDWLLYDSKFSMDNLQMLTLQDLTETNMHCPKILFYSLVEVHERVTRDSETEHACSVETHTESLTRAPSVVSVSHEPEQFYPVSPGAHEDSKLTRGCTNDSNVGDRSLVTTDSGHLRRQSLAYSDVNSQVQRFETAAETNEALPVSAPLNVVKRSRSTPLPAILKTISGVDQRHKSWKGKFSRRNSRKARRSANDKSCIIS